MKNEVFVLEGGYGHVFRVSPPDLSESYHEHLPSSPEFVVFD